MSDRAPNPLAPKPVNWKVNLAALWISQFIAMAALNSCFPFLPLYLQESRIVPAEEAAFWAGLMMSVGSVSLMIMSPIWGMLGDRYGRKMMLVRANLVGAFVLYLMGLIDNIEGLLMLRLLHGAFTGVVPAAQTLVATNTPDRHQGFAMGLIMAGVNAGGLAGTYFGGMTASAYGPVTSFKLGGIMLFVATALVVFFVRENFTPPERRPSVTTRSARIRQRRQKFDSFKAGLPLMLVIGWLSLLQMYDQSFLSLYIDSFTEASARVVYGITGEISAISMFAAIAGSIATGVIMDWKLPAWAWPVFGVLCCFGAAWIVVEPTLFHLGFGRAVFFFFQSGLSSALIVVLGRMTPNSKRGSALGWSMTTRALGNTVAPVTGAALVQHFGYGASYGTLAVFGALLAPMLVYLNRLYRHAFLPDESDPPSMGTVGENDLSTPAGQGRVG